MRKHNEQYRAAVLTDLDGTLLNEARKVGDDDHAALVALAQEGCLRAVVTGRSLYSADRVLTADLPIDFLVFSSGAGVMHWPTRELVNSWVLTGDQVRAAADVLLDVGVNFMIHEPVPRNHHFVYFYQKEEDTDFERRCEIYRPYCQAIDRFPDRFCEACQLIAVIPPDVQLYETIRDRLPDLTVIRTTSPLGADTIWVEIFPPNVSKAQSSAWLVAEFGIPFEQTYALGNDYNDTDLLEWAAASAVVANAPPELRARFPVVPAYTECGFSVAVQRWGLWGSA